MYFPYQTNLTLRLLIYVDVTHCITNNVHSLSWFKTYIITFNVTRTSHITVRSIMVVPTNEFAQKTQNRKETKFTFLKK